MLESIVTSHVPCEQLPSRSHSSCMPWSACHFNYSLSSWDLYFLGRMSIILIAMTKFTVPTIAPCEQVAITRDSSGVALTTNNLSPCSSIRGIELRGFRYQFYLHFISQTKSTGGVLSPNKQLHIGRWSCRFARCNGIYDRAAHAVGSRFTVATRWITKKERTEPYHVKRSSLSVNRW